MTAWDSWAADHARHVGAHVTFNKLVFGWVAEGTILELGCSAGQNIPIIAQVGPYRGMDISESAVQIARAGYPDHAEHIKQGDFSDEIPWDNLDAVVERASVAHNTREAIDATVENVYRALKPGGIFVSSDWFSMAHSEAGRGLTIEHSLWGRTLTGFNDGQFRGVDRVHFSTEEELREIFHKFEGLYLQERRVIRKAPGFARAIPPFPSESEVFRFAEYTTAVWDLVVRKP